MDVNDANQNMDEGEEENLTITEPEFDVIDLSEFGIQVATDINDRGDIAGGRFFWEQSSQNLFELDFTARALNNSGQVVGGNKYWDLTRGSITIEGISGEGVVFSSVQAYDINDYGDVVGEVDSCYRDSSWDDVPEDYCDYDFWSMQWNNDHGNIKEMEWFSTAISNNNKKDIASIAYTFPPHDINISLGDFGPYEQYGYGEPNSINESGVVVGWINKQVNSQLKSNINTNYGDHFQKDLSLGNKLLRLTNTTGSYSVEHVVEMLKNETLSSDGILGASNFKLRNVEDQNSRMGWNLSEQKNIVEAALSTDFYSEAFIWDIQSGIKSLGNLGGSWSVAFDVNDHGQVVGYSDIGNGEYRAFYWDQENGMIELPSGESNSIARAINNHGQIVGYNDGPVMWEVIMDD